MQSEIVIIGAGLSGLSAAYNLKGKYEIFEKNSEVGGLCRSIHVDGFTFDYGPHILYTIDPYASKLIKRLLEDSLYIRQREAWIYHGKHDIYTRFPFQSHLYGLPKKVVKDCILGLFEAKMEIEKPVPKNYHEWMNMVFGRGITEHLMVPYAKKIWTVSPDDMNYDWIERRVPQPDLETILDGALGELDRRVGFNNDFWYPQKGGIHSLPNAFAKHLNNKIHLEKEAVEIDIKRNQLTFKTGEKVGYDKLISTLPLPEVVKLIKDVPKHILETADDLKHNSILCVNIGVKRPNISDKHWLYFYEKEFSFHRISFQMNFSPHTVPQGMSSVSTEVAYSRYRGISKTNIIDRVVDDLITAKILNRDDEVIVSDVRDIRYAYIIYDHNHRKNVNAIHGYLKENGIYPCGRFGEWEYFNMDHSILSGKKASEVI